MTKKKWKPHRHSDEATMREPKFLPRDPVTTAAGESGRVMFSKSDGIVFVELSDGRKAALHEDTLQWPAHFQPVRRR